MRTYDELRESAIEYERAHLSEYQPESVTAKILESFLADECNR